jgi:predicted MFS family arabinose efflux permease
VTPRTETISDLPARLTIDHPDTQDGTALLSTATLSRRAATTTGSPRLPWSALLVMALTGFILIATETMPAGLLPQIAAGMGVTEGTVGQYVSAYALGTVIAAIPAITLTRGLRRKPLLLIGLTGFLVANTVTALTPDIALSLATRFLAGAFSGLLWGMLAGYARRITTPELAGRALSIASLGTPVGLAVGTPFGSWLGTTLDWRWSFGALSLLTLITLALIVVLVPDASGQRAESRTPLHRVATLPGVAAILAVVFVWMLAHNTVYTYISAYLRTADVGLTVDAALVVFGLAALVGIWITGAVVDRALRPLVLASIALFAVAGGVFILGHGSLVAVLIAIAAWGVAFGGAAAQVQTAIGEASGENADVANALLGVSFNLAIFTAGVLGALLISGGDGLVLPAVMIALAVVAFSIAAVARRSAFPVGR